MPITTHTDQVDTYRGDTEHWLHVMEHLFVPAIEAAGFKAIVPMSKGSAMIHAEIVKNLATSEMVLCDLSSLNANVSFELGVRTSLDKPIAIVRDEKTKTIPFDLSGTNVYAYRSSLDPWSLSTQIEDLTAHLEAADESCNGKNPMWQQYGLKFRAEQPSSDETPTEAKLDLILSRLDGSDRRTLGEQSRIALSEDLRNDLSELNGGKERRSAEREELKKILESWSARHATASYLWLTGNGRLVWSIGANNMTDDQRAGVEYLTRQLPLISEVRFDDEGGAPDPGSTRLNIFPPF